jgi:hypothetical protein
VAPAFTGFTLLIFTSASVPALGLLSVYALMG